MVFIFQKQNHTCLCRIDMKNIEPYLNKLDANDKTLLMKDNKLSN